MLWSFPLCVSCKKSKKKIHFSFFFLFFSFSLFFFLDEFYGFGLDMFNCFSYCSLLAVAIPATALLSHFSHVRLCNPIDGSPPGCPIPGILQARTLEWVAISFSNAWKWKGKVKSLSRVQLLATPWTATYQAPLSTGFSRQEYCSGLPIASSRESSQPRDQTLISYVFCVGRQVLYHWYHLGSLWLTQST